MPIVLPEGAPDPVATLKPTPGINYEELARANLAVAESGVIDMRRLAAELVALKEREKKGKAYLREHHDDGAYWVEEADLLLRTIQDDIHSAELELAAVEMQVWKATCSTYVSVQMLRRTSNAPTEGVKGPPRDFNAANGVQHIHSSWGILEAHSTTSPQALWEALVGDREPPGSFPLTEADLTLETMKAWPFSAGHWEADELESLLEQKR